MGLSSLKNITKKNGLAITLSEAKAQCYVVESDNSQDAFITALIKAAQVIIEESPNVPFCFFENTFEAIYDSDSFRFLLPKFPLKSITKVEIYNGTEWQDTEDYYEEIGDDIAFVYIPIFYRNETTRKVKITFVAGELDATNIRFDAKQLVALNVANLFDNRNAIDTKTLSENPLGYSSILNNFKRITF